MRRQNFRLLLLTCLLTGFLCPFVAGGNEVGDSEWALARESNDVSLYYRWIDLDDGTRTREMKIQFSVNAGINEFIEQFSTPEKYTQWAAGIKECEIEKVNNALWYTYTVMNYPWPLRKKDLITRYLIEEYKDSTLIQILAVPEYKPELKGIERVKDYSGTWTLIPNDDGTTSVDYRVVSCEKPVFPRAIQDSVIQRITLKSISELIQLAEAS